MKKAIQENYANGSEYAQISMQIAFQNFQCMLKAENVWFRWNAKPI